MPDGSSSAAPVMRPGPSSAKNCRTRHGRAIGSASGRPSGARGGGRSGVIAVAPESTSARMSGMDRSGVSNRDQLRAIAHRAMAERGLLPDFSPAAQAETEAIRQAPTDASSSVRDLRDLLWCSIDNDDSRDLDQLSVAAPMSGDAVRILIAVADVDALVKTGSAIDAHAKTNTTSVYTAAEIFPMLPEKLSTDLTSLGEGQMRLAVVIEMVVAGDGTVAESDVYRAVVLNKAKLAYNGVGAWLEGTAPAPPKLAAVPGLDEQLHIQDRVAQAMKSLRHQHGALTLDTLQPRAVFDGDVLSDLRPDEKNRAKELIEDFMIGANGVTAKYLESKAFPSLRRVLRSPERWGRLVELAAGLGGHLPPAPSAEALEAFLAQRRLKAALAHRPVPYRNDELDELARHCTVQEDNVAKVERQVQKSAAALLLASRIGEQFDAIVTGASEKGTWVRILRPPVEGKLVQGFEGLDVGDRVR